MSKLKIAVSLLIYVSCFAGLLLQVSNLYSRYMQRNTQVSQTEVPKKDLVFPSITLCVDFWTDKEALCELLNQNCSKQAMRIFYTLFQQNVNAELRLKTAFDGSKLFWCTLKGGGSCLSGEEVDCSPWIRLSSSRRPLQMCYTLDVMTYDNVTSQCSEPWLLELHVGSHIKRKDTTIFMKSDLVPVIALEPQTSPLAEMANIELRPGYRHIVTMKQQLIKRLPAPFESNCVNYKDFGYRECLIQHEISMCGCITFTHEFTGNLLEYPACLSYDRGFEYCKEAILKTPEFKQCLADCRAPCREVRYDLRLASIVPMEDVKSSDRDSHFEVTFRFSSSNVEQLEYSPLLTLETVLAYVGGSFGVWIGISSVDIAIWILHKFLNQPCLAGNAASKNVRAQS